MGKVSFIFALHNHQPVGNFDHIFRESFDACYKPFVEVLAKHPSIKTVLHFTGPLLDWIEKNDPAYLDLIGMLTKRGQVEMLSGGYYEPLLTLIPEEDALGQLRKMNEYLENRFNAKPNGFWLTERVWEPTFPTIAQKAGLAFTALDDSHFQCAGLRTDDIRDFYLTENEGSILTVFPISKFLRYSIPFKNNDEIMNYFKSFADRFDHTIITLADDGEKFGVWPGTHQWVYKEKWLENFFICLEKNSNWLETSTFSECLKKKRAVDRVYLPTASYSEMMEWVLPPEQHVKLNALKERLNQAGLHNEAQDFIRGGYFRNFFAKYSEAHAMKSKQFYVSKKVNAMKACKAKNDALKSLWKGECNCPYWHGVFGGLYLHHLRRATYENLITAESIADKQTKKSDDTQIIEHDVNFDGINEIIFESKNINLYIVPHEGGAISEVDYKPQSFNVTDTMTKRYEAYHELIKQQSNSSDSNGDGKSIHDIKKPASPEVRDNLIYDKHLRLSLVDKCIGSSVSFKDFGKNNYDDLAEFYKEVYSSNIDENKGNVTLEVERTIGSGKKATTVNVAKTISIDGDAILINYVIKNDGKNNADFCFGSEWNFNFNSSQHKAQDVSEYVLDDEWSSMRVVFSAEKTFSMWRNQIKTVSQTESDYCLTNQGTSMFAHWNLKLSPGKEQSLAYTVTLMTR